MTWKVSINGAEVGRLQRDENDMVSHFEVPAGVLQDGANRLEIEGVGDIADDIEIGPIRMHDKVPRELLNEARLTVAVTDADHDTAIPCRLTILDRHGTLVPVGLESKASLAVRTGVIYSATGRVSFGLPAGDYRIFAGRGLEYGQASVDLNLEVGQRHEQGLAIRREVDTLGWVSCDTHVHTVTHSGHGDATIEERMVTLAGENVELPVATDHNKQIDYEDLARQVDLSRYFTPVIGNEVTTPFGHFNAFPFRKGVPAPNHRETDWSVLLPAIFQTPDVQVVILNHGRDVHSGYRPFGPENFNEATGESLNGREFLFNAMETLNSGAQQTDPFELFRDWIALTNRGYAITPIGSSDSHDVNRYIVGQGRTYIRCDDSDVANVDVLEACKSIRDGRVSVSAGLFVDAQVDGRFGPGDVVTTIRPQLRIRYVVRHPSWITADRVQLFQNGVQVCDTRLAVEGSDSGDWQLPRPKHDVFLTVMASGPGIRHPSWPIAQPYQPDGPDWSPKVFGFTGAIWVDGDGDGKFQSAASYARAVVSLAGGDLAKLLHRLAEYDEAVATQAAGYWQAEHGTLLGDDASAMIAATEPHVRAGFGRFLSAWRNSQIAQVGR